MKKFVYPLLAGLMAACVALPAAANYSQIITFGDSLSDNGNLLALTHGAAPAAPYFNGRFSNGPVAVEVMAAQLGLNLLDFAYGGAQTGTGNIEGAAFAGTGVAGQIAGYGSATSDHADASALYVVWAGPNDFFASPSGSTVLTASLNIANDIQALYGMGARDFFVPFMPNLGLTASAYANGPTYQAQASALTSAFNSVLNSSLGQLAATLPGIQIKTFDTAGFMSQQVALLNAQGKDTTHACVNTAMSSVCANPDNYLFWDGVHPTAAAHQTLGLAFAAAAVPEPETFTMALTGLLSLSVLAFYRRKVR